MRPRLSGRVLVGGATVLAVGVGGTAMAAASTSGPTAGGLTVSGPAAPGHGLAVGSDPALKRLSAAQAASIGTCLRAAGFRYPAGTRIMGLSSASEDGTGPAGGPPGLTITAPHGAATKVLIPGPGPSGAPGLTITAPRGIGTKVLAHGPVPPGAPSPKALDAAGRCAQANHLPGLALVTGSVSGSGTSMIVVVRAQGPHFPAA